MYPRSMASLAVFPLPQGSPRLGKYKSHWPGGFARCAPVMIKNSRRNLSLISSVCFMAIYPTRAGLAVPFLR